MSVSRGRDAIWPPGPGARRLAARPDLHGPHDRSLRGTRRRQGRVPDARLYERTRPAAPTTFRGPITVPAGPAALTAAPGAASTGVLAVQVGVGDGRVDGPGNRNHAAGGVDAAPGDRLQAAGLEGEAEVHRLDGVPQRPRAGQVEHVPAGQQVDPAAVAEL